MTIDLTRLVKQGGIVAGGILVGLGLWYVVMHYDGRMAEQRASFEQALSTLARKYEATCEARIKDLEEAHNDLVRILEVSRVLRDGVSTVLPWVGPDSETENVAAEE